MIRGAPGLSWRPRRLRYLPSAGETGAALLGSTAAVLGLGLLVGRGLGAVLALEGGSGPAVSRT
jgi:hypothetical protein